jgi:UDP-N-acetylglucosamine diphosphorylase / glucose-1-phosphate thymidylyltransferase / UDP-N-acetylgalactosamine diphosphorylase / glucosamine-1-phosphate N-acetyltransferase / galactosamine-1-phosphate N-acetyltransferase
MEVKKMVNIVIPMAGAGSRFVDAGFTVPKPFIDVSGVVMIERVLENLKMKDARFILIGRDEHLVSEEASFERLREKNNCEILTVDKLTEGAACTILLSSWLINSNEPLLLANSDQIVEMDIEAFIKDSIERKLDGSILTFPANHPKWSYAKIDSNGHLMELREKKVISEYATVGLYYYQRGRDFVNSAIQMIANNDRANNEFYTAPAYNYSVKNGLKIGVYNIEETQMHGLGTPEDLDAYIKHLKELGECE